jgi:hypothetical protein
MHTVAPQRQRFRECRIGEWELARENRRVPGDAPACSSSASPIIASAGPGDEHQLVCHSH